MNKQKRILISGLTRDSEKYIKSEIKHLNEIFSEFGQVSFYLIESDSKDRTLSILESLADELANISFTAMGKLETLIPLRTERLRFCRNEYVKWIRDNIDKFDYVVIVDFDGMNNQLTKKGLKSSLDRDSFWDACFPNQLFGYYDLYALRCKNWIERDFLPPLRKQLQEIELSKSIPQFRRICTFLREDAIRRNAIYRNMKLLPPWGSLIEVDSAFGALAIYKPECFMIADYGEMNTHYSECEHVVFHRSLILMRKKLVINPRMINNWFNPYNLNKFRLVRFLRYLRKH